MTIHWKAVELYFTVVFFCFSISPDCNFKNVFFIIIIIIILELRLSGMKGLNVWITAFPTRCIHTLLMLLVEIFPKCNWLTS